MDKTIKRRGRPATGRKRDKKITLQATEKERDLIKDYVQNNNYTLLTSKY